MDTQDGKRLEGRLFGVLPNGKPISLSRESMYPAGQESIWQCTVLWWTSKVSRDIHCRFLKRQQQSQAIWRTQCKASLLFCAPSTEKRLQWNWHCERQSGKAIPVPCSGFDGEGHLFRRQLRAHVSTYNFPAYDALKRIYFFAFKIRLARIFFGSCTDSSGMLSKNQKDKFFS